MITGKSAFDISEGQGTSPAAARRVAAGGGARVRVSLRPRAASTARRRSSARTGRRSSTAVRPTSASRIANGDSSSTRSHSTTGQWPGRAMCRSTRRPPTRRTSRSARRSASRATGRSSVSASPGSSASDRSRRSAAPRLPASICRWRSRSSTRRQARRDRRGCRTGCPAGATRGGDPEDPAAQRRGQARVRAGEGGRVRHERVHHLPPRLPARVRRHRALRRQLRDRELALDHDRAAHARVRDDPDARSLAPAGARLDRDRGARRRNARIDRRSVSGLVLAKGLFKLFDAVGFTLPNQGLLLETRTIVVSLLVGILVTLLASLRPAIRATRVPPIAAVREGATLPESRFARFRTVGSLGLAGPRLRRARVRAVRKRPRYDADAALDGHRGASDLHRRRALLRAARAAARERARGAGGTVRRRRWTAREDNARRNPQRTASTAAALMIGLALVTLVATLAAGITSTFRGAVNDIFTSDYAITAQNNFSPIPTDAAEAAAKAPGVEAIASTRTGEAKIFGSMEFVTAVDEDAGKVLTLEWTEGSQEILATLGADGAFVDDDYAKDHDLRVGSPITVQVPLARSCSSRSTGSSTHPREAPPSVTSRSRARPSTATTRLQRTSTRSCRCGAASRREHTGARDGAEGLPQREGSDARRVRRQPDQRV